ncbi:MAG TPA: sugar ABC transporter permease [Clostridiales bacterium]|nr:sugar ABC transporter permease [Clostridiales bacterium]
MIFTLGPMLASFVFSLTNYRVAAAHNSFVGLENYIRLFSGKDPLFYKSLRVTFTYALMSVPLNLTFAFGLAMLMNRDFKGKAIFRSIYYLPTIVPVVATSLIWTWLLDPDLGLINTILRQLNLPTSKFIYQESTVLPSLALMNLWTCGGTMVIFLAGLQDVPRVMYEAAEIDGSNWFHKLIYITLPMMSSTIFFNLVMGIINGLQTFTQSFIMTQGGPNNGSLFFVYYLYREAFELQEMGKACAIAWVLFIIIFALTMLVFRTSRSWVYYEGER